MAQKQTNIWVYVIIALIVGVLIGYAVAGGFAGAGQATRLGGDCGNGCTYWPILGYTGSYACNIDPNNPSAGLTCCDCGTGAHTGGA